MKLNHVHVCGFRGYRKPVRIDFAESYTIIDGRNGVGKSTVFDAVEFALTGTISKYLDAKSGRESVADYMWWSGNGDPVTDRFVEVGFRDGNEVFTVRRTPFGIDGVDIDKLAERLVDLDFAPKQALGQLCTTTIIRDEHIARLSLDLKEGDRFALLRDAIGAVDADEWISRAQALTAAASARVKAMAAEADQANQALLSVMRQLDRSRAALAPASLLSQAASRLQLSLRSSASPDQLPDLARQRIANISKQYEKLRPLAERFDLIQRVRATLSQLSDRVLECQETCDRAKIELAGIEAEVDVSPQSAVLNEQARQLEALVNLGRELGMRGGHCPLCNSELEHAEFHQGLAVALDVAKKLDMEAVERAARERALKVARSTVAVATEALSIAIRERDAGKAQVDDYDRRLTEFLGATSDLADIEQRLSTLNIEREAISADLRLIDTISLDQTISRALHDEALANERVVRSEVRLGKARLAEMRAKVIYDAARRAAAETLDQRLDRVLPLMSELYKRLRPHPTWSDIEYSVRGDVQRFLKLQVGGDVNPQFVFSSGQRRATGLAFLLSVNLSITWSRWRTIMLDDPVQHVDDFRTVHLAEVLAHLCQSGRQVICSVEDGALADLMCRRLQSTAQEPGKRVTLGNDEEGALATIQDRKIAPFSKRALVLEPSSLTA